MPLPPSPDADSNSILKPAQPVRRRSARLSTATNLPNGAANGTTIPSSLKNSISANGHGFKSEIEAADQVLADETAMRNQAVPNGSALESAPSPLAAKLEETAEKAQPDATVVPSSVIVPVESSLLTPPMPAVKPKIDWEVPRKALHSSIGVAVLVLYGLSFTIPPIVSVLFMLLIGISSIDFVRLRNPAIEALYERVVGFLMRDSEKNKVNGTVWYLIGVIIVLTFYPADIAVVSILILSWADTAASTIGRLWGRYTPPLPRRIPYLGLRFAPRKSTAGYAAAWITGGLITSAFLGYHSSQAALSPVSIPKPTAFSWSQFATSTWEHRWTMVQPYTNFHQVSVTGIPSSWSWGQRVGGGWPGLVVMGLWSGFVTAIAEAMELGDADDNLTLPILSGLGIWIYISLLQWIDRRML
ncbi:hypothetical protein CPB86DRAFT_708011 [Serendipita vermifera]|nr:hypothetical protein CPB86DRAFT_708011 [Serendipita vermifera]